MSNLLAEGMATLATKMKNYASSTVTYRRGSASVSIQATIGRLLLRTTDGSGSTNTELTDRDFVFKAADLILNGSQTTPRDMDTIDAVFGSTTKRFTVMPIGNEKAWRYSDEQGETTIRVHTKHTGNV